MALPEPGAARPAERSRRAALLDVAADLFSRTGYTRTSLRDVADAAGIRAGSIYHHFPSKEALAVELVAAFHAELDEVAWDWSAAPSDPLDALREFAQRLAAVAGRHLAAVHLCTYEPPSTAGDALRDIVRRRPESLDRRWDALLRAAADRGRLRPGADPLLLRAVLGESVLDLPKLRGEPPLGPLVASMTDVLLDGLTPVAADLPGLDSSPSAAAAREAVASWPQRSATGPQRRADILAAARDEFARRGYEATTVRDIADAAGLRASSLYRHFDSKQAMVAAIIGAFSRVLLDAFESVVAASTTATGSLDGILVVMSSATGHFRPELRIMRAWFRVLLDEVPEGILDQNAARLALLAGVLERGVAAGEFRPAAHPALLPLALRDVVWTDVQGLTGVDGAAHLAFLRTCVLGGAALPAG